MDVAQQSDSIQAVFASVVGHGRLFIALSREFCDNVLIRSVSDPCIFTLKKDGCKPLIVGVHVDDLVVADT